MDRLIRQLSRMSVMSTPKDGEANSGPGPDRLDEARKRVASLLPRDEKGVLPLCFTIEEQVQNRLRDLNPGLVRIVLREITVQTDYLERIRTEQWRYALNGEPVEQIQRYQREFATGVLALREMWEREKLDE